MRSTEEYTNLKEKVNQKRKFIIVSYVLEEQGQWVRIYNFFLLYFI